MTTPDRLLHPPGIMDLPQTIMQGAAIPRTTTCSAAAGSVAVRSVAVRGADVRGAAVRGAAVRGAAVRSGVALALCISSACAVSQEGRSLAPLAGDGGGAMGALDVSLEGWDQGFGDAGIEWLRPGSAFLIEDLTADAGVATLAALRRASAGGDSLVVAHLDEAGTAMWSLDVFADEATQATVGDSIVEDDGSIVVSAMSVGDGRTTLHLRRLRPGDGSAAIEGVDLRMPGITHPNHELRRLRDGSFLLAGVSSSLAQVATAERDFYVAHFAADLSVVGMATAGRSIPYLRLDDVDVDDKGDLLMAGIRIVAGEPTLCAMRYSVENEAFAAVTPPVGIGPSLGYGAQIIASATRSDGRVAFVSSSYQSYVRYTNDLWIYDGDGRAEHYALGGARHLHAAAFGADGALVAVGSAPMTGTADGDAEVVRLLSFAPNRAAETVTWLDQSYEVLVPETVAEARFDGVELMKMSTLAIDEASGAVWVAGVADSDAAIDDTAAAFNASQHAFVLRANL